MHMADALVSPAVGGAVWVATAATAVYCAKKVREQNDPAKVPLMGVTGAFIFAAQMLNFTIPGTGSSGHLGGGLILAILLGPEAAFLTMASVLTVQALFFADGGLLALGCNIFNLGVFPAFIAYPIFKRIVGEKWTVGRVATASVLGVEAGLLLGALGVVFETTASQISALPFATFVVIMLPIHAVIALFEALVTAAVVLFVRRAHRAQIALGARPQARADRAGDRRGVVGSRVRVVRVGGSRRSRVVDREGHRERGTRGKHGGGGPRRRGCAAGEDGVPARLRLQALGGRRRGRTRRARVAGGGRRDECRRAGGRSDHPGSGRAHRPGAGCGPPRTHAERAELAPTPPRIAVVPPPCYYRAAVLKLLVGNQERHFMEVVHMRTGIHPEYVESKVHCSCGNTFITRSTKAELHIELCNKCHPFYTGQQKFVDTGGRVQRFSDKFGGAADTVMAKTIALKEARQKAHEDALAAARDAKAVKDAAEAERLAKLPKPKAVVEAAPAEDTVAVEADAIDESAVEETPAEAVVEEAPAEAVVEAEEAPAEAVAEDAVAAEEAPADEPAADEPVAEVTEETVEAAE
jgi:ribosomal protein L31/cobalamin biosynthesis protein CbiM